MNAMESKWRSLTAAAVLILVTSLVYAGEPPTAQKPGKPVEWSALQPKPTAEPKAPPLPVRAISGIDGQLKIPAGSYFRLQPNGTADGKGVIWFVNPDVERKESAKLRNKDGTIVPTFFAGGKPGIKYRFTMVVVDGEDTEQFDVVGEVEGKIDPDPDVDPKPPKPPLPVPDTPIPGDGLKVLIVYESAEVAKLTPGQQSSIFGQPFRDYLNSKCVVGPDGKTKEWRIYDKDTAVSADSDRWQAAMKRGQKSIPWIVIGNKTTGFEGPLPTDAAAILELVKKYAE